MKITFENKILYLPIVEAKEIKEGLTVPLLFEIPECLIQDSSQRFDFKGSEPLYPGFIREPEQEKVKKIFNLDSNALNIDEQNRTSSYQLATFWHFFGDATHHSQFISTPFGFYPGFKLHIENRYNVKPTPAYIKDIRLTRVNEEKWFWLVEIKKI